MTDGLLFAKEALLKACAKFEIAVEEVPAAGAQIPLREEPDQEVKHTWSEDCKLRAGYNKQILAVGWETDWADRVRSGKRGAVIRFLKEQCAGTNAGLDHKWDSKGWVWAFSKDDASIQDCVLAKISVNKEERRADTD